MKVVNPWQHLAERDQWARPPNTSDDQAHLMVQVMESWFLVDTNALATYFGQGFSMSALPGAGAQIEGVPKDDVISGLRNATRNSRRGEYHKGRHSPDLLKQVDPKALEQASPWFRAFTDALRARLSR